MFEDARSGQMGHDITIVNKNILDRLNSEFDKILSYAEDSSSALEIGIDVETGTGVVPSQDVDDPQSFT